MKPWAGNSLSLSGLEQARPDARFGDHTGAVLTAACMRGGTGCSSFPAHHGVQAAGYQDSKREMKLHQRKLSFPLEDAGLGQ